MFTDRIEAGRRLSELLRHLAGRQDVVVLGLPRGGVPVADQVASVLGVPMDVIVVHKLGVPYRRELAMGAVGEGGVRIIDRAIVTLAGVSEQELEEVERRERTELERRAELYRAGRERISLRDRVAVIVDDGIAAGATIRAAARVARALGAARVVIAAPVAPDDVAEQLSGDADEVVLVETPYPFYAIGQFYLDFAPTTDEEVIQLLERAGGKAAVDPVREDPPWDFVAGIDEDVDVRAGNVILQGHLNVPGDALGTVIFVHGSGSSRDSPRNRHVARLLNQAGLGTLLFDLLTPDEELDRANVFDIVLLASRLIEVTEWLTEYQAWPGRPIGYFGASTGAAAALRAAAEPGIDVSAVVSRGGRPDLTGPSLTEVRAPVLLIVGGLDTVVLDLNRSAQGQLHCENRLEVVQGASHLFEEPGALDKVAELARYWFATHLTEVMSLSR